MIFSKHRSRRVSGNIYTLFDQTSDLGVEVKGTDLSNLFENSGVALFDLMASLENVQIKECRNISIQGDDIELLLREWLGELLYLSVADEFLFKSFNIKEININALYAKVCGERFDPVRHILKREIKSVTYHQLKVKRVKGKWKARFVLDI